MSQNYPASYNEETGLYMPDQSMFDDNISNDAVNEQYTNCPSQTPAFRQAKQPISRVRRPLPLPDIDPSYPQNDSTSSSKHPSPDVYLPIDASVSDLGSALQQVGPTPGSIVHIQLGEYHFLVRQ